MNRYNSTFKQKGFKRRQLNDTSESRYGLKRPKAKPTLYAEKMWRTGVKERDGYNCQRCGVHSKQNHAHHIAPRSRRPDLKFDRKNGITLCADCHRWVHENPVESTAAGLLSDATYEAAQKATVA